MHCNRRYHSNSCNCLFCLSESLQTVELINSYKLASPPTVDVASVLDGDKPFDINFCFPIRVLENERIKLEPFVPALHLRLYQTRTLEYPDLFRFMPYGPFRTLDEAAIVLENGIRRVPSTMWFAIVDKTRPADEGLPSLGGAFAGTIGLLNTLPEHASTEIGHIVVLPAFQRTHVTSNAIGLLLQYLLELPSAATPGLGLRRVQWIANAQNRASVEASKRMGFKLEGIERWHKVLPAHKEGLESRAGDPITAPGRHTALLAFCWDDWENGGREHVQSVMNRL